MLRATALAIFLYVALKLFWYAHVLFFAVFLGVLFGLAVSSAVDRLQRFRIPRGIAAAIVVVGFYTLLGGFFAWMAPTIREQSKELRTRLPEAIERVQRWVDTHQTGVIGLMLGSDAEIDSLRGPAAPTSSAQDSSARTAASTRDSSTKTAAGARDTSAKAASNARDTSARTAASAQDTSAKATAGGGASDRLKERISEKLSSATRFLFPFVSSTLAAFGGLLLITFLAVYIGAEPTVYRAGLMHLFPHKARARADEVLSAMAVALRKWLVTQLIAMATIGTVSTVALLILKVKAAVALGILAGLFEFIPTIGPIISAVPAVAMGFLDSPEKALTVLLVYVAIQFLENHILIPLLMRGGVDIPPALTVVTQALMALIFGFIGLMVAVPLLAAVMVPVKMLYVEGVVGDPIEVLDEGDDDDG
ncbi:MAG TPA: AI-2E family transporter [Gemmatimonadaceae bacterium]|nr:AI-2E family transporter [Gemmatimonadaceae bacterium]